MDGMSGCYGKAFLKKYKSCRGLNAIPVVTGRPPVNKLIDFFRGRKLCDGRPCSALLGGPVPQHTGWWRIQVSHPTPSIQFEWRRLGHATQAHVRYCFLYHDIVQILTDPVTSEPTRGQIDEIRCFAWESQEKHNAEFYSCYVELLNDGWFCAVKLELRCPGIDLKKHP